MVDLDRMGREEAWRRWRDAVERRDESFAGWDWEGVRRWGEAANAIADGYLAKYGSAITDCAEDGG